MRSLIIAPGDDEAKLAAALASEADAIVIDLDVDAARREKARANAARFLREAALRPDRPAAMARVAPLSGGETDPDLDAIIAAAPRAVLLPKARWRASVQQLSVKLALREALCGLKDGATGIIAIVDTAAALLSLASFCGASARLIGIAWDAEALRADVGAETARDGGAFAGPFRLAREMTLFAAAAANVAAIDTAFADASDDAATKAEALAAKRTGFGAKFAIDPAQAKIINAAFAAEKAARR
ncbi:MAG TPA: aldolase/citrate lyase family protein [Roseiarcus sp.]|nr:aldolase/citrate lyase family protein [Roseiarcus sp.]